MPKSITAYKAFNPDWTCRDFKFEVGKSYKQDGKIKICENSFHACENPLDTLSYYNLIDRDGNLSNFAEVELSGDADRKEDGDTKIAAAEITKKAELTLPDFIKKSIDWVMNAAKADVEETFGNYSQLAASGHNSQLAASGDDCVITSSGRYSRAKGKEGTWISLAGFDGEGKCAGFAVGCIGKGGLKPDTYYRAKAGKLVEAGA